MTARSGDEIAGVIVQTDLIAVTGERETCIVLLNSGEEFAGILLQRP